MRRRRIVHSRSTNPDLSESLNVTPALFAAYLNLFFRPNSAGRERLPNSHVQPSVFDMLAGASPASAMDGWAE